MINQFFKFGPHNAGVGTAYGFGEYLAHMAVENKPAIVQSVDHAGVIYQAQLYGKDEDVLVFRFQKNGLDLLNYSADPIEFARRRWADIVRYWPPELDPAKVWTVAMNEPSKEISEEDWIAECNMEIARLALESGRRYLAFGWSGGTPEVDFWENPTVLEYLELCGEHEDLLGISLHEYSFTDNLRDGYPYLVGRFQFLLDVCDDYNIEYPTIVIGEFGWREASLRPSPDSFVSQLTWAQDVYKAYPHIAGAAIWTLGKWSGTVVGDLESNMTDLTRMAADYEEDDVVVPPDPPQGRAITVILSPQFHQMDKEQKEIVYNYQENGFPTGVDTSTSGEHTLTPSHDDGFDLFLSGNNDSIMGVPFPHISGYTPTWINENYDVGERTIIYLNTAPEIPDAALEKGDLVVDLSAGNGIVNFDTFLENDVKRIIIRATSGKRYNSTDANGVDNMFWINARQCIYHNLPTECYMYLNNEEPFDEQVERFYKVVNEAVSEGLMVVGVAIDCEGLYSPQTENSLREACTLFADLNSVCENYIIYSGGWWWNNIVSPNSRWPLEEGFQQWAAYHYNAFDTPLPSLPPVNAPYTKLNGFGGKNVRYWQFTSTGGYLVGHRTYHLDLNYFIGDEVADPPDPPDLGELVEMAPYFASPAPVGYWMVFTKGDGTIDHQYQEHGGVTYRLKGNPSYAEFEEMVVAEDHVWRRTDTSPGGGAYYRLNDYDNSEWSRWCPSSWRVGDKYLRRPHEKWYTKDGCNLTADRGYVSSYLVFHAIHDKWSGGSDGIEFEDVIELRWQWTEDSEWLERYFLAPRYGYVGWENSNGSNHYCIEIPEGRPPMKAEAIGCLDIPLYN